jgi:hypothetical protein
MAGGNYTVRLSLLAGQRRSQTRLVGGDQQSPEGEWKGDGATATQGAIVCRCLTPDLGGARLFISQPGGEFVLDAIDPPCALNLLLPCEVWLEIDEPLESDVEVAIQVSEGNTNVAQARRQEVLADATAILAIPQWCQSVHAIYTGAGNTLIFRDAAGVELCRADVTPTLRSVPCPPRARQLLQTGNTPITILFSIS